MTEGLADLGRVIDEGDVLGASFNDATRCFRLHLAILAHPKGDGAAQPERVVLFNGVGRVLAQLRPIEYDVIMSERSGHEIRVPRESAAIVPIGSVAELNEWLHRFEGTLYSQPFPMIDRPEPPAWCSAPSIDIGVGDPQAHNLELWFDEKPSASALWLRLFVTFERVDVFDEAGVAESVADLIAEVDAWWRDMREGRTHGQFGVVPGPSDD